MLKEFKLVVRSTDIADAPKPSLHGNIENIFRRMILATAIQVVGIHFCVDELTEISAPAKPATEAPLSVGPVGEVEAVLDRITKLREKTIGNRE